MTICFSLALKMRQEVQCETGLLPTSLVLPRPGIKALTKRKPGHVSPGAEEVQGVPGEG